jgi:hypothetical protein
MRSKNIQLTRRNERGAFLTKFVLIAVILASVAGAFTGLDANSLWLDEIFTAYFSDPNIDNIRELISRAAEDVHPPVYYILVWAVNRVFDGDFAVVARGLSALLSTLAIGVLYKALPSEVGRFGRLAACAFAASSSIWYSYSQEARSYALVFLLVTILILLAFRIRAALAENRDISVSLCGFAFTGMIASLTHFYIVPIIGSMTLILIILAKNWYQRFSIALSGVFILVVVVSFLIWHADKVVADVSDTWFSASPRFLIAHTTTGIRSLFGQSIAFILTGVFVLIVVASGVFKHWRPAVHWRSTGLLPDYILLGGSAALSVVFAVLISVFLVPSFSSRFFIVIAPLVWAFFGLLVDSFDKGASRPFYLTGCGMLLALVVLQSGKLAWRDIPVKQPWRSTAQAVTKMTECNGAPLPVVTFNQRYINDSEAIRFYGYYLANGPERKWLEVPRDRITQMAETKPYSDIISSRISGEDECPILLWSVFHTPEEVLEAAIRSIKANAALPEGSTITLRAFRTPELRTTPLREFFGVPRGSVGFLILVEREPTVPGAVARSISDESY